MHALGMCNLQRRRAGDVTKTLHQSKHEIRQFESALDRLLTSPDVANWKLSLLAKIAVDNVLVCAVRMGLDRCNAIDTVHCCQRETAYQEHHGGIEASLPT
jgi:two-component sensor histidine kinase